MLQKEENQNANGHRCRMIVSRVAYYCGNADHETAFVDAIMDNVPELVTDEKCKDMVYQHQWIDPQNHVHKIDSSIVNVISMTTVGMTENEGGEVSCQGENWKFQSKIVYNIVVHMTYKIIVEKVRLKSKSDQLFDMTNRISLAGQIEDLHAAAGANGRYIWKLPKKTCPMSIIRDQVTGVISTDNDGHKVLMSTNGDLMRFIIKRPTVACSVDIFSTNYDGIYLYYDLEFPNKRPPFNKHAKPENTQLFTYAEARDDFLFHSALDTVEKQMNAMLRLECVKDTNDFLQIENRAQLPQDIFNIRNDSFALHTGEVTYYFRCRKTFVQARLTKDCYRSLPITVVDNEGIQSQFFLEPVSRRISTVGVQIPCNSKFVPKYENQLGNWIQATPHLTIAPAPPAPESPIQDYITLDRPDITGEGIYTQKQLNDYKNFMEFGRMKEAMGFKIMGQMHTFRESQKLTISDLFPDDPVTGWVNGMVSTVLTVIATYGHIMAVLVGTYWILSWLQQIFYFFYRLHFIRKVYGLGPKSIWTELTPSSALMKGWRHNTVVRPKRPPRPPRSKRHQSAGRQFPHEYLSLACINQRRARSPIAAYGETNTQDIVTPKTPTCPRQSPFFTEPTRTIHPNFTSTSLPPRRHQQNFYNTTPTGPATNIYPTMHTPNQLNILPDPHQIHTALPSSIANTDQVIVLRQPHHTNPRTRPTDFDYSNNQQQRGLQTIEESDSDLNSYIRHLQRQTRQRYRHSAHSNSFNNQENSFNQQNQLENIRPLPPPPHNHDYPPPPP